MQRRRAKNEGHGDKGPGPGGLAAGTVDEGPSRVSVWEGHGWTGCGDWV